jgi:hypothetical protein
VIKCPFCKYTNNNKSNMNRHICAMHPSK